MSDFKISMYSRLKPRAPWTGGRITDTDLLSLAEATSMATQHAGKPVTVGDFLRAAGRGEILLRAIVHRRAKMQSHDGGICCNAGHPTDENVCPAGAIPTLPVSACKQLANAGRASWRTFDGHTERDGMQMRFDIWSLTDDEPDYETVLDDCRVMGDAVHALADAIGWNIEKEERAQIEAKSAFDEAFNNSGGIDWRYWVHQMATLTAKQVARLMCGLDPDEFSHLGSGPNGSDDHRLETVKIERLAQEHSPAKDAAENWLQWADKLGLEVHGQFRLEVGDKMANKRGAAPVVDAAQIEPTTAIKKSGYVLRRRAAVKKHKDVWPTIEADFNHASENGLSNAAKAPPHGEWYETALLDWAAQRGKLVEPKKSLESVNSVFAIAGRQHRIEG